MKHGNENDDFQEILAALNERELTDWERERLWELLEADPDRISDFTDHCFLEGELGSLRTADLLAAGIEPPAHNIVAMPASGERRPSRFPAKYIGIAAGLAAVLALGLFLLNQDETASPELAATPKDPEPSSTIRRAHLSLDDPSDEGVALSGPAALSNSRNPRGGKPEGAVTVPEKISFNHDVRPILAENCFFCHGPDEKKQKGDLRLDLPEDATADRGGYAAIVPGDAKNSAVWDRIISGDPDEMMPPPDSHRELSAADREILRRWIDSGAEYQKHWAFIAPERPGVPEVTSGTINNPIDAFILSRLEQEGLKPNPMADARTLLRRLSLDLIGLPPNPQEYGDFETAFESDANTAVESAIDRLLTSPHFGERMALPWLDAARYADSNGFQQDGNRHQWPWRDWVIRAYNENMPFDRFTIEQLAGDLLPNPTQDQIIATAFNRNHMLNGEGGAIKEEQRINYVLDRVDTTATTWLALTMACAQCHSHKYDPISHDEYYEFFAFFNNIPESGGVDKRSGQGCAFGTGSTVQVARPLLSLPTAEQTAEIEKLNGEIKGKEKETDALLAKIDPLRREWESGFSTAELVDRTRFPGSISNVLRTPEEQRKPSQQRDITEFYLAGGNHGDNQWKQLGNEIKNLRAAKRKAQESIVEIMVMEENPPEKKRQTFVLNRGDYQQPTTEVEPGTPAFLPAFPDKSPKTRLGLARWLIDPQHPLTARVMVNRIWQQIFGTGIVKTAEDFGVQGELPVHPELLDWLAVEFIESGWDVKHIVHLIVSSSTYQQDAKATPEKLERDPDNRLLARGVRSRLPAMLLRDQALAVSGLLLPGVGGEPVYPHQPEGLWQEFSFGKISYPHREETEQLHRRSIYTFWRRTSSPPDMFDSSSRQVCTVKPSTTNTPLHALTLMNDETYVEAARALAKRIVNEGGDDAQSRLSLAFELATGEQPDERERQLLLNGYERSLNEFQSFSDNAALYAGLPKDPSHPPIELAAYTRMAQVILNLDQTLNNP